MRTIGLPLLLAAVALAPVAARAAELVVIRPGVMCESAVALGRLTLPDGESRSHAVVPHPADLAIATAGHCSDLALGSTMTAVATRRNTSIVTEPGGNTQQIVPNIDVQPVADGTRPVGDGRVLTQHLPVGDGRALDILEDARITPELRQKMWGAADDPGFALGDGDPRAAGFKAHPLLPARLRLVAADGHEVVGRDLDEPLAMLMPAPLDGLPSPTVLLMVDDSSGMGSYSGPETTLLVPQRGTLDPERAVAADGTSAVIALASTLKTTWRVVPARTGRTQEIELAACRPVGNKPDFVTTYSTYRFRDGGWHVSSHFINGLNEFEAPPDRSLFP